MERDDEAITGQAALEFSEEAKLHPERYDYLARYLTSLIKTYNLRHIMDFGCGPAILTSMVAGRNPNVSITAIDLSGDMLIQAGRNTHTQQTQLIRYDIKRVFGNAPDLADLVFS